MTSPLQQLPGRRLDKHELRDLVDQIAAQPQTWASQVRFSGGRRHYVSLHRDVDVDVWLLCWTPDSDTGWHDHDSSSGAVTVVQGSLRETNPRMGGEPLSVVVPTGSTFSFGPEHIHRLGGEAPQSVSIHAYSPPLWRLGQYSVSDDGVLTRFSVSYADELRPLAAV